MTEPSEARAALTIAKAIAQSTSIVSPPSNQLEPSLTAATELLLRPRRSVVIPVTVFGFAALLTAIGIRRLEPLEEAKPKPPTEVAGLAAIETHKQINQLEPQLHKATSDSVRPDQYEDGLNKLRSSFDKGSRKEPINPADPFKSYALDVAQLYIALASFPKAKGD